MTDEQVINGVSDEIIVQKHWSDRPIKVRRWSVEALQAFETTTG